MRGVIYARYSSDNQREESIEGQIRENTAYAEKNGITIVGHYIDRALSAKTDNRPEFQRMINDSAKKKFDVVIVWKLDRFSRNRYDSAKYKAMLRKNDVKVISATESISGGAEGIILESVLEGMAEYYSADLAEKVSRGMTENALKARFNGGQIPLGFTIDDEQHYQIDPEKAPLVIEMFRRYAGGESITDIIEDLNARGVRTSQGNRFNKNSLARIFANRRYIGEYAYKDAVIPGAIPAIVSKDVFERVAIRMGQNKHATGKAKAPERYLLTTKLFCGTCNSMFVGDTLMKFRNLDLRFEKNKERLIDGLVKAIFVYDDYIKLILTFDDKPINIPTTEEIENMANSSDIQSNVSPCKEHRNVFFFCFVRLPSRPMYAVDTLPIVQDPQNFSFHILGCTVGEKRTEFHER